MANFAVTPSQVVDSLNYVLSGPSSIGNDFRGVTGQGFVYLTGDATSPYVSPDPPVNPPLTDQYIETDMFVPVNITEANQQIVVTGQMRLWAEWTASVTSKMDIYFALNRYKYPNILYYPHNITEFAITLTASAPSAAGGELIANGSTGMVFTNIIDQPGEIGTYYYWLEAYLYPVPGEEGDLVIDWLGVDLRSISASLIKP